MGVDQETLAMNIALLIGGAILLTALFFIAMVTMTGVKCLVWIRRQRKAEEEFLSKHRRSDGEKYPPFMEGTCTECGRGNEKVYFTAAGEELCPPCYERSWENEARSNAVSRSVSAVSP